MGSIKYTIAAKGQSVFPVGYGKPRVGKASLPGTPLPACCDEEQAGPGKVTVNPSPRAALERQLKRCAE